MKNPPQFNIISDENHQHSLILIHTCHHITNISEQLSFLQKGNSSKLNIFCSICDDDSYFYAKFFDLCFSKYRIMGDWYKLSCKDKYIEEFILLLKSIRGKFLSCKDKYDKLLNFYIKYTNHDEDKPPHDLLNIINKHNVIDRNVLYKEQIERQHKIDKLYGNILQSRTHYANDYPITNIFNHSNNFISNINKFEQPSLNSLNGRLLFTFGENVFNISIEYEELCIWYLQHSQIEFFGYRFLTDDNYVKLFNDVCGILNLSYDTKTNQVIINQNQKMPNNVIDWYAFLITDVNHTTNLHSIIKRNKHMLNYYFSCRNNMRYINDVYKFDRTYDTYNKIVRNFGVTINKCGNEYIIDISYLNKYLQFLKSTQYNDNILKIQ